MNNARRKQLIQIGSELRALAGKLSDIKDQVESPRDEEQEAYDNLPESFQNGEKGQAAQEAITSLENAIELLTDLEEAADHLDNAAQ